MKPKKTVEPVAAPEVEVPAEPSPDREQIRRERRFAEIGRAEGEDRVTRLRNVFAKYVAAKPAVNKDEKAELLSYGIILPPAPVVATATASASDICDTLEALAVRLDNHYRNADGARMLSIEIKKNVISAWRRRTRDVKAGQPSPPGNLPGMGNRNSFADWVAWCDKYIVPHKATHAVAGPGAKTGASALDDEDLTVMEQREKREAIIHRRWERDQKKGEYVHRSIALATGIAAVKKLHLMVKVEDERNHTRLRREKLLEIGVPAELVERFAAWDNEQMRQVTDRREDEMVKAAAGIKVPGPDELKTETKETLT